MPCLVTENKEVNVAKDSELILIPRQIPEPHPTPVDERTIAKDIAFCTKAHQKRDDIDQTSFEWIREEAKYDTKTQYINREFRRGKGDGCDKPHRSFDPFAAVYQRQVELSYAERVRKAEKTRRKYRE